MTWWMSKKKRKKLRFEIENSCCKSPMEEYDNDDDCAMVNPIKSTKKCKKKRSMEKQSGRWLQNYFAPQTTLESQPNIKSVLMDLKELVDNAWMIMARWWYDANVLFNGG